MKALKTFLVGNRMKSFYWRTGMMIVAAIIASLLDNLELFATFFHPAVIAVFGLVLGEISKGINNSLKAKN